MTALRLALTRHPQPDSGRAVLRLDPADMARAGLHPGATVAVTGHRRTHARVLPKPGLAGRAFADETLAANLGAAWGDLVTVEPAELFPLHRVELDGAVGEEASSLAEALCDMSLTEGDAIALCRPGPGRDRPQPGTPERIEARVVSVSPGPAGRVGPATRVILRSRAAAPPAYPGIAGLDAQIAAVHEVVELPLLRPDLFERLGLTPPRGLLFTGPPGSGKTLLARALAERTNAGFFHIAGPEIVSKHYGETERALRDLFKAAAKAAPSIVFIDEIDAIAPQRAALSGEKQVERRVVGQLLTLLDGLEARERVVVIAATNLPDTLDPALRRPGRFEREITFGAPDAQARERILALHLSATPLAAGVDIARIAVRAKGFLGADLAALAREACLAALARETAAHGGLDAIDASRVELCDPDFDIALSRIRPSLLRADAADDDPPTFRDIGGMATVKQRLTDAVIRPIQDAPAYRALGLSPPSGILLAGPPGTGKTLVARALAQEAAMNFVRVQPATVLSQYLGEAERAVAATFRRARLAAPCLLFFDELDTIAPERGQADAAMERLVAQLLTELDGGTANAGVVVVAATNRVDRIDPALLRPGRFDLVIETGLPDAADRREILRVHLSPRRSSNGIDLETLARATAGATPAGLASIVADAARGAFARWRESGEEDLPSIEMADLLQAIERHGQGRGVVEAAARRPGETNGRALGSTVAAAPAVLHHVEERQDNGARPPDTLSRRDPA